MQASELLQRIESNSAPVVVDQRAVIARFLLGLYGYPNMDLLDGYLEGWKVAGLPTEQRSRHPEIK
jgi:3-mercaptopyruvate sulfurtransferase SseA